MLYVNFMLSKMLTLSSFEDPFRKGGDDKTLKVWDWLYNPIKKSSHTENYLNF